MSLDHVVAVPRDGHLRTECKHCGAYDCVALPVDIREFARISREFLSKHVGCKPCDSLVNGGDRG